MEKKFDNSRANIRFDADPNSLTWIQDDLEVSGYDNGLVGLTVDESHSGCNVIFRTNDRLIRDVTYRVLVGDLSESLALLRWIKVLNEATVQVGFQYKTQADE